MRIAIYSDSYVPYRSGVTTAIENQSQELVRRGHEVTVFCPRVWSAPRVDQSHGVRIVKLPVSLPVRRVSRLNLAFPLVATSYFQFRRWRPDVLHLNTEWGAGWEGLVAGWLFGVPTVGTFHTFFAEPGYLRAIGLPDTRFVRSLMWKYSVFYYSRCDAVTSPSRAVKQALVSQGLDPEPLVLSNGITPSPPGTPEQLAEARRRYGVAEQPGPTFIHVGRISPEKSLDVLLLGFRRLVDRRPDVRLLIVGSGPYRGELTRQISQLRLDGHVQQLGYIAHEQLISEGVLRLGDVFVTASKTENQPLSIMEAMAAGVPVIGPAAQGIPELVIPGETGELFPPDDVDALATAMESLGWDPASCRRMGEVACQNTAAHTIASVVDQFEQIFERVIEARRQAVPRNGFLTPYLFGRGPG